MGLTNDSDSDARSITGSPNGWRQDESSEAASGEERRGGPTLLTSRAMQPSVVGSLTGSVGGVSNTSSWDLLESGELALIGHASPPAESCGEDKAAGSSNRPALSHVKHQMGAGGYWHSGPQHPIGSAGESRFSTISSSSSRVAGFSGSGLAARAGSSGTCVQGSSPAAPNLGSITASHEVDDPGQMDDMCDCVSEASDTSSLPPPKRARTHIEPAVPTSGTGSSALPMGGSGGPAACTRSSSWDGRGLGLGRGSAYSTGHFNGQ